MYRATRKACQQEQRMIPSFGFSGAGFLTAYHLGAAKCLLEHGQLNCEPVTSKFSKNNNDPEPSPPRPILTGVSGGALTIAAIASGVNPEVGMNTTLAIASQTRQQGGFLDAFKPGFSLLDQVEKPFLKDILDAVGDDTELLLRRIQNGKLLRIGLTNRSIQPAVKNPKAYCFVNQYRDAEDIVAACILSSFIAGVTGPYSGSSPTMNRATTKIKEMAQLGFIQKQQCAGGTLSPVQLSSPTSEKQEEAKAKKKEEDDHYPPFIDGGLSDGFPVIDHHTVLVTPIRGRFEPNRWVCPAPSASASQDDEDEDDDKKNLMKLSGRVKIYMNRQNARTFRRMILSSEESVLQSRYSQGYDDAKRFLIDHNLETIRKSFGVGQQKISGGDSDDDQLSGEKTTKNASIMSNSG